MMWRAEFVDAWDNRPDLRFFMLEWARRHRKTSDALMMLVRDCMTHNDWVSLVVAPFLVQGREIVWDDPKMLFTILPNQDHCCWEKNESKLMLTFPNRSILRLEGGDKLEGRRGIDCNDLLLTEFSYCKEDLWTKIFMPIMSGQSEVARRVIFDYTPCGENHATDLFDWACKLDEPGHDLPKAGKARDCRPGWWCSRVTNDATQFLDREFLILCRDRWPRQIYDQEINCARITQEEMTLVTSEMLHELNQCLTGVAALTDQPKRIVSIDPAFGGDVCKIMGIEDGAVVDEDNIRDKHNTSEIVMAGKVMAQRIDTKNFIVDSVGNGLGVADGLSQDETKYHVQYFVASEGPHRNGPRDELQFANRRAEAYYYTAERIRRFETAPITSQRLMRGLPIASRYSVSGKNKILIQPKTNIKEVLGRSPDDEDAYVMGQWGLQFVQPENEMAKHSESRSRPRSAMC
jgi:hypothetical protein